MTGYFGIIMPEISQKGGGCLFY